jgi:hypothetical protein
MTTCEGAIKLFKKAVNKFPTDQVYIIIINSHRQSQGRSDFFSPDTKQYMELYLRQNASLSPMKAMSEHLKVSQGRECMNWWCRWSALWSFNPCRSLVTSKQKQTKMP